MSVGLGQPQEREGNYGGGKERHSVMEYGACTGGMEHWFPGSQLTGGSSSIRTHRPDQFRHPFGLENEFWTDRVWERCGLIRAGLA